MNGVSYKLVFKIGIVRIVIQKFNPFGKGNDCRSVNRSAFKRFWQYFGLIRVERLRPRASEK